MKPTDILSQEHRVIERVLTCLEWMAERCESSQVLNTVDAEQAVDFFRTFADQCHHKKEETHLFPALEAKGFSRENGPTGVMLYEHEQGRGFIRGMVDSFPAAGSGERDAQKRFVQSARHYIDLLRQHIQKEDHCLFMMANQALSAAEQQQLTDAFTEVEREHIGPGTHEQYLQIANELAARYGVPVSSSSVRPGPGCGCGH